jgi:hypothetical protein
MLTSEQYQIIKEQLSKDNASDFVKELLIMYANSVEKTSELISYISLLADKQLQMKQDKIIRYSWATDLLIADRYSNPGKYVTKNDSRNRFCVLFYTCKAHFSLGNAENDSIAGKAFFNEFVGMLVEKKEFDYTNPEDWKWIYTTAGGADWLESVIKQHIDKEFVKPKEGYRSFIRTI